MSKLTTSEALGFSAHRVNIHGLPCPSVSRASSHCLFRDAGLLLGSLCRCWHSIRLCLLLPLCYFAPALLCLLSPPVMINMEYLLLPLLIITGGISIRCVDDILGRQATRLLDLCYHHHVDPEDSCFESQGFKLLEEQVAIRELTLSKSLPLRELDLGVSVLPEPPSDFLDKVFVSRIELKTLIVSS